MSSSRSPWMRAVRTADGARRRVKAGAPSAAHSEAAESPKEPDYGRNTKAEGSERPGSQSQSSSWRIPHRRDGNAGTASQTKDAGSPARSTDGEMVLDLDAVATLPGSKIIYGSVIALQSLETSSFLEMCIDPGRTDDALGQTTWCAPTAADAVLGTALTFCGADAPNPLTSPTSPHSPPAWGGLQGQINRPGSPPAPTEMRSGTPSNAASRGRRGSVSSVAASTEGADATPTPMQQKLLRCSVFRILNALRPADRGEVKAGDAIMLEVLLYNTRSSRWCVGARIALHKQTDPRFSRMNLASALSRTPVSTAEEQLSLGARAAASPTTGSLPGTAETSEAASRGWNPANVGDRRDSGGVHWALVRAPSTGAPPSTSSASPMRISASGPVLPDPSSVVSSHLPAARTGRTSDAMWKATAVPMLLEDDGHLAGSAAAASDERGGHGPPSPERATRAQRPHTASALVGETAIAIPPPLRMYEPKKRAKLADMAARNVADVTAAARRLGSWKVRIHTAHEIVNAMAGTFAGEAGDENLLRVGDADDGNDAARIGLRSVLAGVHGAAGPTTVGGASPDELGHWSIISLHMDWGHLAVNHSASVGAAGQSATSATRELGMPPELEAVAQSGATLGNPFAQMLPPSLVSSLMHAAHGTPALLPAGRGIAAADGTDTTSGQGPHGVGKVTTARADPRISAARTHEVVVIAEPGGAGPAEAGATASEPRAPGSPSGPAFAGATDARRGLSTIDSRVPMLPLLAARAPFASDSVAFSATTLNPALIAPTSARSDAIEVDQLAADILRGANVVNRPSKQDTTSRVLQGLLQSSLTEAGAAHGDAPLSSARSTSSLASTRSAIGAAALQLMGVRAGTALPPRSRSSATTRPKSISQGMTVQTTAIRQTGRTGVFDKPRVGVSGMWRAWLCAPSLTVFVRRMASKNYPFSTRPSASLHEPDAEAVQSRLGAEQRRGSLFLADPRGSNAATARTAPDVVDGRDVPTPRPAAAGPGALKRGGSHASLAQVLIGGNDTAVPVSPATGGPGSPRLTRSTSAGNLPRSRTVGHATDMESFGHMLSRAARQLRTQHSSRSKQRFANVTGNISSSMQHQRSALDAAAQAFFVDARDPLMATSIRRGSSISSGAASRAITPVFRNRVPVSRRDAVLAVAQAASGVRQPPVQEMSLQEHLAGSSATCDATTLARAEAEARAQAFEASVPTAFWRTMARDAVLGSLMGSLEAERSLNQVISQIESGRSLVPLGGVAGDAFTENQADSKGAAVDNTGHGRKSERSLWMGRLKYANGPTGRMPMTANDITKAVRALQRRWRIRKQMDLHWKNILAVSDVVVQRVLGTHVPEYYLQRFLQTGKPPPRFADFGTDTVLVQSSDMPALQVHADGSSAAAGGAQEPVSSLKSEAVRSSRDMTMLIAEINRSTDSSSASAVPDVRAGASTLSLSAANCGSETSERDSNVPTRPPIMFIPASPKYRPISATRPAFSELVARLAAEAAAREAAAPAIRKAFVNLDDAASNVSGSRILVTAGSARSPSKATLQYVQSLRKAASRGGMTIIDEPLASANTQVQEKSESSERHPAQSHLAHAALADSASSVPVLHLPSDRSQKCPVQSTTTPGQETPCSTAITATPATEADERVQARTARRMPSVQIDTSWRGHVLRRTASERPARLMSAATEATSASINSISDIPVDDSLTPSVGRRASIGSHIPLALLTPLSDMVRFLPRKDKRHDSGGVFHRRASSQDAAHSLPAVGSSLSVAAASAGVEQRTSVASVVTPEIQLPYEDGGKARIARSVQSPARSPKRSSYFSINATAVEESKTSRDKLRTPSRGSIDHRAAVHLTPPSVHLHSGRAHTPSSGPREAPRDGEPHSKAVKLRLRRDVEQARKHFALESARSRSSTGGFSTRVGSTRESPTGAFPQQATELPHLSSTPRSGTGACMPPREHRAQSDIASTAKPQSVLDGASLRQRAASAAAAPHEALVPASLRLLSAHNPRLFADQGTRGSMLHHALHVIAAQDREHMLASVSAPDMLDVEDAEIVADVFDTQRA